MTSSVASYEQLVRQVEALKAENNHLRQELRDNSSHLSKLETETSGMKEVLKHLQCKLEQEARVLVSSGQTEVLEQLKALQMDITSLYNLKFQPPALGPEPAARTPEGSPVHGSGTSKDSFGELSRATIRLLEELDRERCFLLNEIEKEEKEKLWYYSQLQGLSKRLDELPHVETQFSMQMDLIRQQLEFESQHIRSLMEERFGTSDEMVQRAQIRASRLEQIDKELLSAQDRVQQTEPQALLAVKSVPVDEDPETKVPMHPEDSAPQPGNSKVEVVFWLLSMLATRDQEDTARTLLAMSSSPESCVAMRRSGCLPLLLQILHGTEAGAGGRNGASGAPGAKDARMHANAALHNIIFSQPDQGLARKEMRVLHVLEQIRAYCETCWDWLQAQDGESEGGRVGQAPVPIEPQICQATCAVMKLSFDEEYRRAMNELGGLQAVAELLQVDYEMYKMTRDPLNLALRRYAGMTLTNLTFGDVANKATLCARRGSMEAIVAQLASESEDLQQVVSSILRNLSWRADINSKKVLREVGSMTALMQCVLRASKESTLKSVLSALWNLSAHSTENKAAICQVDGALGFLVSTLTYKCQSNSLAIIESGGGILRNVSSLIATREDYRQVLRDHNCLQTLLQHLTSHSLTIVSNACGTLWNLSARSPRDQELLWDLGAVAMLRNLVHSKHKMIAMGSAAALRNLLAHRPAKYQAAATAISPSACVPSLYVRKQRALEAELDARHLAQALDHLEKQDLPEAEAEAASKKPLPPLRHLDGLAQDYASDSGCFDDDDVPSLAAVAATAEPASPTVLSLFLGSSFLQGQALARAPPAQRSGPEVEKEASGEAALAARAKAKLALAVARIDRLVEDISALHTSSDDSFSLSSGDPGQEVPREGRAQSYSPCWGPEGGQREAGSRAHPLLRLKAAHASLSNDSLNSGSTSDGHCPRDHTRPLASLAEHREGPPCGQVRPSQLDLNLLDGQAKPAAREAAATDACVRTIKLSPTYQHVPLLEDTAKAGVGLLVPGSRKQAWLPTEGVSKVAEKLVVEAAPLCLSRCSSLSSLSSAGRPGPSEAGDLNDSDSSLEGLEEASPSEAELDQAWHGPGDTSLPMAIPAPPPGRSLGVEDATPSSSSENCVQETPLVLSRCSSVSSLGSFESPSIASSIPSDPCSALGSGTVSPSELPDSPGQTMPPSRSKTPPTAPPPPGERETTQFSLQWESYVKRFLDIADCRERCWLPSELDAGSVRFTVEKPDENFSCASSLSALALHEHYVQKDVELRLLPPACPDLGGGGGSGPGQHFAGHRRRDEANGREGPPATNQELELLRDCLGTAMPTRLCKVASALVPGRCALPVPVYMLVPASVREDNSYTDLAEGTPVNFSVSSLSDETLQGPPKELPGGRGDRQKPAGREAPTRQAAGHRHRVRGVGRSTEPARVTGRRRAGLELPLRRPLRACVDRDSPQAGRAHGEGTLQSLCLTTPTEETVYCFYSNGSDEEPSTAAVVAPSLWESAIPQAVKRERLAGRKKTQAVPKATVPARAQPSLIADETPPCYSLSSSTSSLSEPEPEAGRIRAREPVVTKDPGLGGRNDGHPSPRAKVELLRRCIGSAMPRRRPQASDPKCRKPRNAQLEERPAEGTQEHGEEAAGSDHASDLDSVEWRAIQEGANSIVTWLHQAAVADTQEVSSESDSILSFVSGLSVGSTLQPSLHRKGRRPRAEGQVSSATRPEKRDVTPVQRSSSPCLPCGPEKLRGAQKTMSGVPAMLRGRTVIYVPSPASRAQPKGTTGPRTTQRKIGPLSPAQPAAPTKALGPGQQRSRSLHRPGKISELAALTPPQRSATPPARLTKTPSSSSSQTSPASQPLPRRSLPASQASGSLPSPGASRGPKTPMRTLLAKQHKTQKSPVRIPFMQKPTRRGPPPLARATPEPGPRGQVGPKGCPSARGGRLGLVRMASARSSGSESSNCSGFRRQLTFIKESPGLLHRRHLEQLSTAEATTSASQGSSPRRSRPTPPTVFLCSSRCKELRAPPSQALVPQRPLAARPGPTERPPRRTSSESPSRLPIRKQATQPEAVKRYASLPHISMARRPEGAAPGPEADAAHQSSKGEARPLPRVASPGTTWRRIRDEDVPHILRSTLPATALPLIGTSPEEHPGGPPQRKTSDAVVQTEDFSTTKTNSSTSPSLESREHPQATAGRPAPFLSSDVDRPGPAKGPTLAPFIHEGLGVAAGGFAASRHGSPSRSARVPPFNYVPSPMVVATTDSAVEKAPAPTDLLE